MDRVRAAGVALAFLTAASSKASPQAPDRMRSETPRIVVEFAAGALTEAEAAAFTELADRGVTDIETLVGSSLPVWARRTQRIRFIVSDHAGMSRTFGHTVLLPLERVKTRSAPYLHETVHALVPSRGDAVWLSEGLACHLESWVSENRGGYDAHVFTRAGDRDIHAAARRYLSTAMGQAVLPWVGGHGEPPRLEEDRDGVARPFYVLSQSLTKFLVEGRSLDAVVRLLTSSDGDFLGATGRSVEEWKADWLRSLSTRPPMRKPLR
ncbi:MAG: hypothetical protein ACHQNV_08540 [Vicinamibacteria bacterium]